LKLYLTETSPDQTKFSKTRLHAQKGRKIRVFRSYSGTVIVSEIRWFYALFCAFKRVFQNSCLLRRFTICINIPHMRLAEKQIPGGCPSLNPCHSLKKSGRIFQDPESQGSYQVLFKILSQILIIPVNRILFRICSSSCWDIFLNPKKQDPTRIHSRSYSWSWQKKYRRFDSDFLRFLSRSKSNLRIRILSRFAAISDEDPSKKVTRSVWILNWFVLRRFE
jgi:hypothetical protein